MSDLKLIFSEQADRDMDEIWVYLAGYDVEAADAQITSIVEKCAYLTQMPYMGVQRDKLIKSLRRIIEDNYTIFYTIHENEIQIMRVLRNNRNFKHHF